MAQKHDSESADKPVKQKPEARRYFKFVILALAVVLALPALAMSYIYAASPEAIRKPKFEHYHFRMQILVNGKAEDFGSSAYQESYSKDQCTVALTEHPIHFHDNKDQFVHIHWDNMTGGLVM